MCDMFCAVKRKIKCLPEEEDEDKTIAENLAKREYVNVPPTYKTGTGDRNAKIPPQKGMDVGYIQSLLDAEAVLDRLHIIPDSHIVRTDLVADKRFGDKWEIAKRPRPTHMCRPFATSLFVRATEYDAAILALTKLVIFLFDSLAELRTANFAQMLHDEKIYPKVKLNTQEYDESLMSHDFVRKRIKEDGYICFELSMRHQLQMDEYLRPLLMLLVHNSRDGKYLEELRWIQRNDKDVKKHQTITHHFLLRVISDIATFIHNAALLPGKVFVGYCSAIPIDTEKDTFYDAIHILMRREFQRVWRNVRRRILLGREADRKFLFAHMTMPDGEALDWNRDEHSFTGTQISPADRAAHNLAAATATEITNTIAECSDPNLQNDHINAIRDRVSQLVATYVPNAPAVGVPITRDGKPKPPAPEGTKEERREAKKNEKKAAKKARKSGGGGGPALESLD